MASTVTVLWEESTAASVHNRSFGLNVSTIQPTARGWTLFKQNGQDIIKEHDFIQISFYSSRVAYSN